MALKLLILTQKADIEDPILGFFHTWIREFSKHTERTTVICLEKGRTSLPPEVRVFSLGKESGTSRLKYVFNFYRFILRERKNYDAVFIHMNQEYAILGGIFWKLVRKRVYMWRNHHSGSFLTDIAAAFCDKVFCTSKFSYTAKFSKTEIMPVGVDIENFKPESSVTRIPQSVLSLGRISATKKVSLFVDVIISIRKDFPAMTASIYGDSFPADREYHDALREKVAANGVGNTIRFYPGIPNSKTPSVYSAHDIFVNLSSSGMYDKTIFEAAACGCLVLASNENLRGNISDDFIFKQGDLSELSEKLTKLLKYSSEERARAGEMLKVFTASHSLTELMNRLAHSIR